MKEITLSSGHKAVVDDEDYERLTKYRWYLVKPRGVSYAFTIIKKANGKYKNVRMHRMIMNAKNGEMLDHVNRDGLDNRRCNLRFCTPAQNQYNRKYDRVGLRHTSKFKGVYKHTKNNRWVAQISIKGRMYNLGSFKTQEEAARAYDKRALEVAGQFALINFPKSTLAQSA